MKKVIALTFLAVFLLSQVAFAGSVMKCNYPSSCKQIVGTEYSTGGGGTVLHILELNCINKEGEYVTYLDTMGSIGGVIGIGRFEVPDKIEYKKWNKDKLECRR